MAGAGIFRSGEFFRAGFQQRQTGIAQGRDAELCGGSLARRAAFVVVALHQPAHHAGMDDEDGHVFGNGHGLAHEAAAIDEQRMARLPARADQLVHDATAGADEIAFAGLRQQGDGGGIEIQPAQRR